MTPVIGHCGLKRAARGPEAFADITLELVMGRALCGWIGWDDAGVRGT